MFQLLTVLPVFVLSWTPSSLFFFLSLIRSNFLGTKFTVYDGQPPYSGAKVMPNRSIRLVGFKQVSPRVPVGSYPVAHISYEVNVLGSR